MKTALVCGAGGFIGSHLVKRLKKDGYWVRGVDLKNPEFSETEADEFITGDLTRQGYSSAATGDGTYGCTMGASGGSNVIDRFTIATTGNAVDFGDLTQDKHRGSGVSGAAA